VLRIVIDTSSLVSYVLTQGELMRRVVAHWRAGTFTLLSSPDTRAELADVLARPSIRQLATAPLDELVQGLERFSEHVPGVLDLSGACRNPKDTKFLACAVEGQSHYLVSSDRDLLDMRHYRDVAIVNPAQFLLALELYPMEASALAARFGRDVLADIQATVPLEPVTAARVAEALAMLSGDRLTNVTNWSDCGLNLTVSCCARFTPPRCFVGVATKFPKRHPEMVKRLRQPLTVASKIYHLGVKILPVSYKDLHRSNRVRQQHSLLTNDSLIVAVMQRHRLRHLATHDRDFPRLHAPCLASNPAFPTDAARTAPTDIAVTRASLTPGRGPLR